MKKKYYILVFTFLCLFLGQVSYGLNIGEGSSDGDDEYGQIILNFYAELTGFEITSVTIDSNGIASSITTSDGIVIDLLYEVVVINDYHNPDAEPIDPIVPDPPAPDNDSPDPPSPENIIQTWYLDYDGDGYHGSTYQAVASPGDKWSNGTSGVDCDDSRKQYTTVCCTTTCESGYKLNIDTCACELLRPCFGTVKDFETSNPFNSNTLLNKINSTLGDFGISTDVMDIIKQMDIFNPKSIAASTDIATHVNAIAGIGDVSQVLMSYSDYIDEPSTQNLLRLALDSASIGLSPAASLAISTIDYFKDSNGDSKLDLLLKAASDAIDRSIDCNLGLGIRNGIF
jgi:hypothetical protein